MFIFVLIAVFCVVNARICSRKNRRAVGVVLITIALCLAFLMLSSTFLVSKYLPEIGYDISNLDAQSAENLSQHMVEISKELTESYGTQIVIGTYLSILVGGLIGLLTAWRMKPGDPIEIIDENGNRVNPERVHERRQYFKPGDARSTTGQSAAPFSGQTAEQPIQQPEQPEQPAVFDPETMLEHPCLLYIYRDPDPEGADEVYTFSLNGEPVCRLSQQNFTTIRTLQKQNTLTARRPDGRSIHRPVTFPAKAGGIIEFYVKGDSFVPERTTARLAD